MVVVMDEASFGLGCTLFSFFYASALHLLSFIIFIKLRNTGKMKHRLFSATLIVYGCLRFGLETFRGDVVTMVGFLRISQVVKFGDDCWRVVVDAYRLSKGKI